MRPKTVILTLVVTLVLVGLVVALKSVLDSGSNSATASVTEANTQAAPSAPEPQLATNPTPLSDEARAAQVQKELDQINELVVAGPNPSTTSMLLAKLSNPEAEVRKAAVDALVELNDTNAIPAMEQAAAAVQDPHEKVAMLDALAYLKLPGVTDGLPDQPTDITPNTTGTTKTRKALPNQRLDSGKKSRRTVPRGFQQPGPANQDQPQPATPAPEPQQAQ